MWRYLLAATFDTLFDHLLQCDSNHDNNAHGLVET